MPSPFPGMDPFLESGEWTDFHVSFLVELGRVLVPQVRPKYIVRRERRVYVEGDPGRVPIQSSAGSISDSEGLAPVTLTLPMPETHRETFLTIRDSQNRDVVCVIEVLSPSNKRSGSDGRSKYLEKRNEVLESSANLVEFDLLRGGERLPTIEPLPAGDFYCFVSRVGERPAVSAYAWPLRNRLPEIPIPLADNDADVAIDLQEALNTVYDESGYDYSLNYNASLAPPVNSEDAMWIQQLLKSRDSQQSNDDPDNH